MTVASSETTRSTHFKLGSLSFTICFFTMASKAMSGVKSPVLGHAEDRRAGRGGKNPRDSAGHTQDGQATEREKERKEENPPVSGMHGGRSLRPHLPGSCFGSPGPGHSGQGAGSTPLSARGPGSLQWTRVGPHSSSPRLGFNVSPLVSGAAPGGTRDQVQVSACAVRGSSLAWPSAPAIAHPLLLSFPKVEEA